MTRGWCVLALLLVLVSSVHAEETSFWDNFKDPEDGKFDILGPRKTQSGLLPIIIPFNEPAVGIGAVGGLAYFHPRDAAGPDDSPSAPPSISFGGGLYADNGTWAVAGGHMGVWDEGDIRYLGGLAYASVYVDFYGIGRDSGINSNPIPYHIEGGGTVQQIQFRLWDSAFFAGTKYVFAGTNGTFDTDEELDDEGYSNNAGLSLFSSYDTRDNVFTPNAGTKAVASFARFSPRIGGDFTYGRMDLLWNQYLRLGGSFVFGLRMEYRNAGHGAPVYALPWVRLRGIPAFRYLGYHVAVMEIEPRWKIDDRWSLLAFLGVGRAAINFDRLKDAENANNYGGGFRYLIARGLGLAMGLDVARGPEETVGYLTIGSAW